MPNSINPVATIYTLDGIIELMQCGYFSHSDTHIKLMLSLPEFIRLSNLHEDVLVVLTNPSLGLLPYVCRILPESVISMDVDTNTEQHIQLNFLILQKKENIQRRKDVKVKTEISLDVKLIAPRKGTCHGMIADISASGLLFITEEQLETEQEFQFLFQETKEPMEISAKVLHQYKDGRTKHYGCVLFGLSKANEEVLRQYVFHLEALHRRKGN